MPLSTNKNVWISMFIIFSLISGVFLTLFYFRNLFIVILIGLCLIAVFDKTIRLFNRLTCGLPPAAKKGMAYLVWLAFFAVLLLLLMYALENVAYLLMNVTYVEQLLRDGTRELESLITQIIGVEAVSDIIDRLVSEFSNILFSSIGSVLSSVAYFALCAVLLYPFMFYVYFKDRSRLRKYIMDAVPDNLREGFGQASSAIMLETNNYFNAKVLESLGVAAISCAGFYIIGIENWLILGCLLGLLNNIPYIGPWLGAIPPLIVALTISIKAAVFVGIVCAVAQIVDNVYLIPVVVSKKVQVNSLLTVFLILAFAKAFGAFGMILAIPVYIIYRIVLTESYRQLIRIFPSDTDAAPEEENFDPLAFLAGRGKKADDATGLR